MNGSPMTPADFRAWRARLGLTQARAAEALGIGLPTLKRYEKGARSDVAGDDGDAREVRIPRVVALACGALEIGPLSLLRRRSQAASIAAISLADAKTRK